MPPIIITSLSYRVGERDRGITVRCVFFTHPRSFRPRIIIIIIIIPTPVYLITIGTERLPIAQLTSDGSPLPVARLLSCRLRLLATCGAIKITFPRAYIVKAGQS